MYCLQNLRIERTCVDRCILQSAFCEWTCMHVCMHVSMHACTHACLTICMHVGQLLFFRSLPEAVFHKTNWCTPTYTPAHVLCVSTLGNGRAVLALSYIRKYFVCVFWFFTCVYMYKEGVGLATKTMVARPKPTSDCFSADSTRNIKNGQHYDSMCAFRLELVAQKH